MCSLFYETEGEREVKWKQERKFKFFQDGITEATFTIPLETIRKRKNKICESWLASIVHQVTKVSNAKKWEANILNPIIATGSCLSALGMMVWEEGWSSQVFAESSAVKSSGRSLVKCSRSPPWHSVLRTLVVLITSIIYKIDSCTKHATK